MLRIFYVVPLLMILVFSPLSLAKKLYRYVDENGRIHYSDRIPNEHKKNAHRELNDTGITVKRHKRALTKEENLALQTKLAEDKKRQEAQDKQRRYDKSLLHAYNGTTDIDKAYKNRILMIDARVRMIKRDIKSSKIKTKRINKWMIDREISGKTIPAAKLNELKNQKRLIEQYTSQLTMVEKQREKLISHREADKKRFLELTTPKTQETSTTATDSTKKFFGIFQNINQKTSSKGSNPE